MMTYEKFLERVIEDGLKACRESYKDQPTKLEGSVAGFEACRGKTVFELRQQLFLAANMTDLARAVDRERYWYHRCKHAEIEWVCNVVSACLQNQGFDPIVVPTARGAIKAAEIVGLKPDKGLKDVEIDRNN